MDKSKTDKSVKAGLEVEAGHTSTKHDQQPGASYDKGYDEEHYDKEEEGTNTHYDKTVDGDDQEKDII